MIITEILARNARLYGDEVALVEREPAKNLRRAITWKEFDDLANKVANALIAKGVKKGDKVIHLMMNCLEWLPAYFGILRTGAWAVPLNFRFTADDIRYCADIAEARAILFGEDFIERVDKIKNDLKGIKDFIFSGPKEMKPKYAESFDDFLKGASTVEPKVPISLLDEAALYFTSGTTGTAQAHSPHPQEPRSTLALWRTGITIRPTRTISSASHLSITPAPRCTGSETSSWAPRAFF